MKEGNSKTGLPRLGGALYRNPLEIQAGAGQREPLTLVHPDPYVMKWNGRYYAYATGQAGVVVLRSNDLVKWEHLGYGFQMEGHKSYWAPATVYENGRFYLYVSSMPAEEEDVHAERLMVAVSNAPEGPFEYSNTLYDTFSLDAHVVKDEQGDYFLFYSNNEYAGVHSDRPGTVILVDKLIDMITPEGNPQLVVAPTIDEEIYEENRFGDGRNWHTIEGAFYIKRGSKHYVMYSGNAYVRPNYFLGYSMADGQHGEALHELVWRKFPSDDQYEPLLRKNEGVEGVGHNSVVRAPNNVDPWVFYHGRNARDELDFNREQRTMRADPLLWSGDQLYIAGPTYEEQPAPAIPTFRDLFDEAHDSLLPNWQLLAGDWQQGSGKAVQTSRGVVAGAITLEHLDHMVFEASMKWTPDHTGGLYGVYAAYVDETNHVSVMFDVGRRALRVQAVFKGIEHEAITYALPNTFDFQAYHLLRIEKTGTQYQVKLDDIMIVDARFPIAVGAIGLYTRYTSASFAGVEVTRHLALSSSNGSAFAERFERIHGEGVCTVAGSELHCRNGSGMRTSWVLEAFPAIKACGDYRWDTDMSLKRGANFGLYCSYTDEENWIAVSIDQTTAKASVSQNRAGALTVLATVELLNGACTGDRWHTLSCTFVGGNLSVRLDRLILFVGHVTCPSGSPGFAGIGEAMFRETRFTLL
jgi:GH43 family beta-xylosidase